MQLTNTFHCKKLGCKGLSYNTCLIRQTVKNDRWKGKVKYPNCASCEQGQKIKAKFPDWKYVKTSKRKNPDRVNLRKDKGKKSGSREACLKAIDLKPDFSGVEIEMTSSRRQTAHAEAVNSAQSLETPMQERSRSVPEFSKHIYKLFNMELFIKAQTGYIFSLLRDKKTAEAKERIAIVRKELLNTEMEGKFKRVLEGIGI